MKRLLLVVALLIPELGSAQKFEGLAATPPMGWNSWNTFRLEINEDLVKSIADTFLEEGLKDAGYEYIVIDDGWQIVRDDDGNIVPHPEKFPSGIKALADYVHAKGLKFGIYSDAGYLTVLSGKMHFVGPDQLHGFERRLTTDVYPADFTWHPRWDAPDELLDWYHLTEQLRFGIGRGIFGGLWLARLFRRRFGDPLLDLRADAEHRDKDNANRVEVREVRDHDGQELGYRPRREQVVYNQRRRCARVDDAE